MSTPGGPTAEVSVRVASTADVDAVGAVQSLVWREAYAGAVPETVLAEFDSEAFAEVWRRSLEDPPPGVYSLLVSLAGDVVTGYAAIAPSQDPDLGSSTGEVTTLGVHPDARGAGHGSRLLNACVDVLSEAGAELISVWLPATDERTRAFLVAGGFGPDGAFRDRVVSPAGTTLREVRLVALPPTAATGRPGGPGQDGPSEPTP